MLDKWHKKEKPVFTGITRGVGGFGFGGGGGGPTEPGIMEASGGTTHTNGGYKYHVFVKTDSFGPNTPQSFTGPDGFVVTSPGKCDILVVSGGGGGGSGYYGGGAGGGTVVVGVDVTLPATTYSVQVGGRGNPGPYPPGPAVGSDGGKSVFGDIDILGGGYGGAGPGGSANPGSTTGGNAGGASNYNNTGTSNPYSVPGPYQLFGTWTVNLTDRPSASSGTGANGGDGAGGAGGPNLGGVGARVPQFPGPAIPTLSPVVPFMGPTADYYGGGGAGEGYPGSPQSDFAGGFGGGGDSRPGNANTPNVDPSNGRSMLGGGGGGSGNPRGHGGQGGTGIVIVRYLEE